MAKWFNGQTAKLAKKINSTIKQFNNIAILDISRKVLPQVFQPRTAGYILTFILIITAGAGVYLRLFPANTQLTKLKQAVLKRPFSPYPHQQLGNYYLQAGLLPQAHYEFKLAQQLGATAGTDAYQSYLQRRSKLQQEVAFWNKIVHQQPGYRDGYLKLALLYYQLRQPQRAKTYLKLAQQIDPNYPPLKQLEKLLQ